jgi:DNA (cytosine-5)-methyltransferase 1
MIDFTEIYEHLEDKFKDDMSYKLAIITHHFQTYKINQDFYYEKEALKYLEELKIDFQNEDIKWDIPFYTEYKPKFKFIDLFAGIGGMRIAAQNLGGKCIFSSEWDKYAKLTYLYNFGEVPFGDITKIDEKKVPEHDILFAGFPCQAFSQAGKRMGFEDTRGTLFFDVARIIKEKKPKAILLENVKGLVNHDKKRTLKVILKTLREDLNYYVPEPKVLNAKNYGVPQNRERIFIVGFRKDIKSKENFKYPEEKNNSRIIEDILEEKEVSVKYYLSTQYLKTLKEHKKRHESKGNGFGYEILSNNDIANAIVVGGMGRERNLIIDKRLSNFKPVTNIKGKVNREGIRRMTPREWARLQGFPYKFIIKVSDTQAYKQFGNSVAIPAVQAVVGNILKELEL